METRNYQAAASATPPSAPVSPSNGYPTNGNPGTGTPATQPGEFWFFKIGEELRKVITDAGITPSDADLTQLSTAIQNLIKGGDYKASVRVATTANIATLAGGAPNTLDGITLAANDRILVKDQTTGSQNGIYYVSTLGTGANGTWTRSLDADTGAELNGGALVPVEEGAVNADSTWMLTNDGVVTVGTTALVFAQKSQTWASNAEAQAYAVNNKAISPATLAAALQGGNQSLAANGYQKLPGGLILQWGILTGLGATSSGSFSFPIAFPAAVYAIAFADLNAGSGGIDFSTGYSSVSTTGASYSKATARSEFYWLAIGK